MNKKTEKRNYKQEIKEWWNENKRVIKTGAACIGVGFAWGYIRAVEHLSKIDITYTFEDRPKDAEPCDEFGLTESNCDDPELLELVKYENENA